MQEYWEYYKLQTITTVKVAFLKANPNTNFLEMLQRVIGQKICAFLMHKFGRLYRYGGGQFSTIQMGGVRRVFKPLFLPLLLGRTR